MALPCLLLNHISGCSIIIILWLLLRLPALVPLPYYSIITIYLNPEYLRSMFTSLSAISQRSTRSSIWIAIWISWLPILVLHALEVDCGTMDLQSITCYQEKWRWPPIILNVNLFVSFLKCLIVVILNVNVVCKCCDKYCKYI